MTPRGTSTGFITVVNPRSVYAVGVESFFQ